MDLNRGAGKWLLVVFVAIVLAAGSFVLGYFVQSSDKEADEGTGTSSTTSTAAAGALEHDPRPPQTTKKLLKFEDYSDPARFGSRSARTAAWVKSLANSDAGTLREYLRQAKNLQAGSWRDEAQHTIISRLAALDPSLAVVEASEFSDGRQEVLLRAVYGEWALSNLDQAVENAQGLDDKLKQQVTASIVRTRTDLPPDQLRKIAQELDHEWVAIDLLEEERGLDPIGEPEEELESFLNQHSISLYSLSDAQSRLFSKILSALVTQDGIDALKDIDKALPAGYLKEGTPLHSIVSDISESNPELALELALGVGAVGIGGPAWFAVRGWADSEPEAALSAVSSIEGRAVRRMLQSVVMESWASKDPHELLDAMRSMPKDVQTIGQETALRKMADTSPLTASRLLGDIEDKDVRDRTAGSIAMFWARQNITDALDWIENDDTISHLKDNLTGTVLWSCGRLHPQLALNTALDLPPNSDGVGPEAHVVHMLAFEDMDMAIGVLPQTRNDATKSSAYDSVVDELVTRYEDFRQAMDMFIQFAEDIGIPRNSSGLNSLVWRTPIQLFESLHELPSEDLKKRVARSLLMHESEGVFSKEQIATLREVSGSSPRSWSPELDAAFEALLETYE